MNIIGETATVETDAGRFEGLAGSQVDRFLGIRYAQAPVGALRFQPPQPLPTPTETVRAQDYAARNFQVGWPEEVFSELELRGEESEDCLFLNIFRPSNSEGPKPVLFWIHGGAFMCGSGNDYEPSNLVAQNDVVVVTINYRLGVFGFPNLTPLGPEFAGAANLGIQDQVAALKWVSTNIAAFGGDPNNVTIFGESAGAASVLALLGAPSAVGLFHRGIVCSGAETLSPAPDHLTALKQYLQSDSDQDCYEQLMKLPARELVQLQQQAMIYLGPSVDGVVITRPACEAIRDGGASNIPIMAGATRDEGTILAGPFAVTDEIGTATLLGLATSVGRDDGASYRAFLSEILPGGSVLEHMSRCWYDVFRASALRVAATASEAGAGGWVYNFEVETDHPLGIAHFSDVPFTFNWLEDGNPGLYVHAPTRENQALASLWSATVAAFARTGDPNGGGLPEWPNYTPVSHHCLWVSHSPEVVENPDGQELLDIYRVPQQRESTAG